MRAATALLAGVLAACSSAPAGQVRTLAGGADDGFADGAGRDARFGPPGDIVVDSNGVIYVADTFNSAIRRVTPEGDVSTVAGGREGFADGVGTDTRFHLPSGLALDGDDTLYVADAFNAVIRRIDLSTSEVTTVAGRPDERGYVDGPLDGALFGAPFDVEVDATSGQLWVADAENDAIRIVNLDTGRVSTVAGGSNGIADGVGSEAQFSGPDALALDRAGGVWVTERSSHTIRHVEADGTVTTVLGSPFRSGFADGLGSDALLNRPHGMASTPTGQLVFADQHNNVLRVLEEGEGTRLVAGRRYDSRALNPEDYPAPQDGPAGEAQLRDPRNVAVAADGTLYFADLFALRLLSGWSD